MNALPGDGRPLRGIVFNIERYMVYDGPGIRTVVFLKGCPLRCLWCDNPESQRPGQELMVFDDKCIACRHCLEVCPSDAIAAADAGKVTVDLSRCGASGQCVAVCPSEALVMSGRAMTSDEVVSEILKDEVFYRRSSGGVTLGGGEPSAQPQFAAQILKACRGRGIHTAIETCGCSSWEAMAQVLQHTQLVYLDLKHIDPDAHMRLTGRDNDLILANAERILQLADEGKLDVVVRCTCVPGCNDSKENIAGTAALLAKSKVKRLELLRYHELGVPKYAVIGRTYALKDLRVDEEHLADLAELARSYGLDCRIL
ncbi:MAG TPA: glycyl-radical enzyme activating protein [Anaerolineae bacterium]|nr:glycyl-radical enzyme activating protein [Anaerolineae bacterium]